MFCIRCGDEYTIQNSGDTYEITIKRKTRHTANNQLVIEQGGLCPICYSDFVYWLHHPVESNKNVVCKRVDGTQTKLMSRREYENRII